MTITEGNLSIANATKIKWDESGYAYLALNILEADRKKRLKMETMKKIEEKNKIKSKKEVLQEYMIRNIEPKPTIVKLERKEPSKRKKQVAK